jgi:hypothetical protein
VFWGVRTPSNAACQLLCTQVCTPKCTPTPDLLKTHKTPLPAPLPACTHDKQVGHSPRGTAELFLALPPNAVISPPVKGRLPAHAHTPYPPSPTMWLGPALQPTATQTTGPPGLGRTTTATQPDACQNAVVHVQLSLPDPRSRPFDRPDCCYREPTRSVADGLLSTRTRLQAAPKRNGRATEGSGAPAASSSGVWQAGLGRGSPKGPQVRSLRNHLKFGRGDQKDTRNRIAALSGPENTLPVTSLPAVARIDVRGCHATFARPLKRGQRVIEINLGNITNAPGGQNPCGTGGGQYAKGQLSVSSFYEGAVPTNARDRMEQPNFAQTLATSHTINYKSRCTPRWGQQGNRKSSTSTCNNVRLCVCVCQEHLGRLHGMESCSGPAW